MSTVIETDVLVVGGGIAGLWTLQRLYAAGHVCALVEHDGLGAGQTLAAQGIIHGGTKYAVGLTRVHASSPIAAMPARWRACLAGQGEVDLSDAARLADHCWLWADESIEGRLASSVAPALLRTHAERVDRRAWPEFLVRAGHAGAALRLDEPVVDGAGIVRALAEPMTPRLVHVREPAARLARDGADVRLALDAAELRARNLVLCAGAGNTALLDALGVDGPETCLRPLHQVCVDAPLPDPVHGHFLSARRPSEPQLTITTHETDGGPLWYLGGALSTMGVERDRTAQIDAARTALRAALPGLAPTPASFRTLRVDRAEPAVRGARRPDRASVVRAGDVLTTWPMKLALAPDLADQVLAALPAPAPRAAERDAALLAALTDAPRPRLAASFTERAR